MRRNHPSASIQQLQYAMKYLRCLFPLLAFALMFQAGPLLSAEKPASLPELARNGSTEYSILLPEKTGRVMDTAARELAGFLRQSTGATFPVIRDAARAPHPDKLIRLELSDKDPSVPQNRFGFLIAADGKNGIAIRSRSPHGVLYGVYSFLEKAAGCRWFAPDETLVPRHEVLNMPRIYGADEPTFSYRDIYAYDVFHDRRWAQRLRLNGGCCDWPDQPEDHPYNYLPGYSVHTFNKLVPPDVYFKEHPEYYGLENGKRNPDLLCLSNPAVFETALATLRRELDAHKGGNWIVSISQNDRGGWCQCAECRRIIEQEENGVPTGLLMRFINRFDDALKGSGVTFHTLAYHDTDTPPARTRPNEGVVIQLCPIGVCYGHHQKDCTHKANLELDRNLAQWAAIHRNLWIWSYHVNFAHCLQPFPNIHTLGSYMRLFADNHTTGVFAQSDAANPSASLSRLRHYVMARLLWNPRQDESLLIREFVQNYYKEGAPAIMEYLDLLKNTVDSHRDRHTWIYEGPASPHLTPEFTRKAEHIFNTALASVKPGTPAYTRLKTEQLSITYMILEHWNMGKMERTPEEILALLKDFETECAHSHILGLTEHDWDGHTRKEWIQSLRNKAAALIQARPSGGGALKTAAAF